MALDLTAYATAADYRGPNNRSSTDADTLLTAQLTGVSRVLDRRVGVSPGHFRAQTTLTYTVMGHGGRLLRLRDERGEQLYLRTVDTNGIDIDSEGDGTFDGYQLDLADAWVRGYPVNAATNGEPFTALELLPGVASAAPLEWTDGIEVRITGTAWGWSAVPFGIKSRVISITREIVEAHSLGGAMTMEQIDAAIQMSGNARSLMHMLEAEYSRRLPI